MLFKVILVAALLAFVVAHANNNFLQLVSLKSEWKLSLDSLLAADVNLAIYDDKDCRGNPIAKVPCDKKTCQEFTRAESIQVRGTSRLVNLNGFFDQRCQEAGIIRNMYGGKCYNVNNPSPTITCSV